MKLNLGEPTCLIHEGSDCELPDRTPSPPVQRGSTVLLKTCADAYDASKVSYGRSGLATHGILRDALCHLEHAEEAFLYPSGLAAITGVLSALLSAGDDVLACDTVYKPTRAYLNGTMTRFGVTTRYFDARADVQTIRSMIRPETKVIVLESPGSLTFEMVDIPAIAALARELGILTVVDNTWSAGVLFKPLDHGVDVSIQSLTKYVCGHSDVFMGLAAVRGRAVELLAKSHYETGWAVSPDDAYMALRGLRTLHTRLRQHGEAALDVAQWLKTRPEVATVMCPALPDDPGHSVWKRDFSGLCGLIGVVLRPVSEAAVTRMVEKLSLFGLGYSWGGYESLVIPSDPQIRLRDRNRDYPGPVLRLHIGLEVVGDLIADLQQALGTLDCEIDPTLGRCEA